MSLHIPKGNKCFPKKNMFWGGKATSFLGGYIIEIKPLEFPSSGEDSHDLKRIPELFVFDKEILIFSNVNLTPGSLRNPRGVNNSFEIQIGYLLQMMCQMFFLVSMAKKPEPEPPNNAYNGKIHCCTKNCPSWIYVPNWYYSCQMCHQPWVTRVVLKGQNLIAKI